ncbi:hypothetical protein DL96DRAFT_1585111 [Flagelloscypha sp. PMI_526]|nr:hypothetical protein DL96DRAFT_1585111 [Flagelloscypha sp. PMI_526]
MHLQGIFSTSRRSSSSSHRTSLHPPTPHMYAPPLSSQPSNGLAPFIPQSQPYAPPIQTSPSSRSRSRHQPRQSSTGRYESDSELPSNRRVFAPPMAPAPTSMTPHPGDRTSARGRDRPAGERRGSDSSTRPLGERRGSDGSSRSRTSSTNAAGQPLKGILKTSRQQSLPQESAPFHSSEPYLTEKDHARVRPRHESTPAASHARDVPRTFQPPARHGSTSSGTSEEASPTLTRRVERPSIPGSKGPLQAEQISLNWVLTNKFQRKQRNPPIFYDVAWNPTISKNVMGYVWSPHHGRQVMESVPEVYLKELASTHTTMKSLVVHCPRGVLGAAPVWVENQSGSGVTCLDVLKAIYDAYNRIISPEDLIKMGQAEQERCHRHFRRRCEDSPYETWLEEGARASGSRRRIFKGLIQRPGPGISFDLHFEDDFSSVLYLIRILVDPSCKLCCCTPMSSLARLSFVILLSLLFAL